MPPLRSIVSALVLVLATGISLRGIHAAEPRPQRIRFEGVAVLDLVTAEIEGTVPAGGQARYLLKEPVQGERVVLRLRAAEGAPKLRFGNQRGPAAYPNADMVEEWQGDVPQTHDHLITVFAGEQPCTYTLTVTVKPYDTDLYLDEETKSKTVSGELARGELARYSLTGLRGQRLALRLRSTSGAGKLWVGGERNDVVQPAPGLAAEWQGVLQHSTEQRIVVCGVEEPFRYTLEVIRPAFPPGPVTYPVKGASAFFDFDLQLLQRKAGRYFCVVGPGRIGIRKKGAAKAFQLLRMRRLEVHESDLARNQRLHPPRGWQERDASLLVNDYNFDGHEDLALCNGHEGGYDADSYTVFLWDPHRRRFAENRVLSALTSSNDGIFAVDRRRKRLEVVQRDGCCWHRYRRYRMAGNRPVLCEMEIVDSTGDFSQITTRTLDGGRWITRHRREKLPPREGFKGPEED